MLIESSNWRIVRIFIGWGIIEWFYIYLIPIKTHFFFINQRYSIHLLWLLNQQLQCNWINLTIQIKINLSEMSTWFKNFNQVDTLKWCSKTFLLDIHNDGIKIYFHWSNEIIDKCFKKFITQNKIWINMSICIMSIFCDN